MIDWSQRHEQEGSDGDLLEVYMDRFNRAKRGKGFHNCAGFAKYLLGLSREDGFVRPDDSSEKGLICYLQQINQMNITDFDEDQWEDLSRQSDAVALLHNQDGKWNYLHFFVPYPERSRPYDVFERPDFEAEEPKITDIRDIIDDDAYAGDTRLIFFVKK